METGLVALLLAVATGMVLRLRPEAGPSRALVALACLAWLARPDTVPAIAGLFLYRAWRSRSHRAPAIEAAMVAGFVVVVSFARWEYYGAWLPNTYTLKMSGVPLAFRLRNGLAFLTPYWPSVLGPLAFAVAGLFLLRRRASVLLLALFAIGVAGQIYVGGDVWARWRMMAPFFPLLWVAAILGTGDVESWLERRHAAAACLFRAVRPIVLGLLLLAPSLPFWPEWAMRELPYDVGTNLRGHRARGHTRRDPRRRARLLLRTDRDRLPGQERPSCGGPPPRPFR
jgi:hypothetical protein